MSDPVWASAPAKVNLNLHVTGQRPDGYHLLDGIVVFAKDVADMLVLRKAETMQIDVSGPFAEGVPTDARNLCWRAAELYGAPVAMHLVKNLPHAAGIGSGSSDAAAVLRAMAQLFEKPFEGDALPLGADVPVCIKPQAQRMQGIGELLTDVDVPPLHAVLVNPRVDVPTGPVFAGLASKENPPQDPLPKDGAWLDWLIKQRNDLEEPALALAPVIGEVLEALTAQGSALSRMSGSGATCFGLFTSAHAASNAAETLKAFHPNWWVAASTLV